MIQIKLSKEQHDLFNHDGGILIKLAKRNSPSEFAKKGGWFNFHDGQCYICQYQMYPAGSSYNDNISCIVKLHGIEHIKSFIAFL